MYCKFFEFSERPFDVTPDPKYLYLSPSHREMLASLIYGIRERRGFISIVGEVGTGKTTLLNAVLDRIDETTKVAYVFNTDVTFRQMLTMALVELGAASAEEKLSKVESLSRLNEFAIQQLSKGVNVVLIVDEAQNLDEHSMESLRLLSNLETRKHKLIQIILSGQPELDTKLSQPELRQLAQRISMRRYIIPLSETETYDYIQHRLTIAHYNGSSIFDRKALRLIWEYSGGVPRKINILCDNAFLIGYGLRKKRIRASEVEEAIRDLSWSPFSRTIETQSEVPLGEYIPQLETKTNHRRTVLLASLVFLAILVMIVGLDFQDSRGKLREWGSHLYSTLVQGSSETESSSSKEKPPRSAVEEQSSGTQKSIGLPVETTEEASLSSSLAAPDKFVQKQAAGVDRVITSTTDQTEHYAPSRMRHEGVLSSVSQEKHIPETGVVGGQIREPEKIATLWAGIRKRESPLTDERGPNEKDEVIARVRRSVVVESGDTLSDIISRVYGTYDEQILSAVLSENPEINSPHEIFVGQTIKLPVSLNVP